MSLRYDTFFLRSNFVPPYAAFNLFHISSMLSTFLINVAPSNKLFLITSGTICFGVVLLGNLKLVPAVFYQIFICSPNDSPSKSIKNVFCFIEKALNSFSKYSNFCNFFFSFPHLIDSKRQMEVEYFMMS